MCQLGGTFLAERLMSCAIRSFVNGGFGAVFIYTAALSFHGTVVDSGHGDLRWLILSTRKKKKGMGLWWAGIMSHTSQEAFNSFIEMSCPASNIFTRYSCLATHAKACGLGIIKRRILFSVIHAPPFLMSKINYQSLRKYLTR